MKSLFQYLSLGVVTSAMMVSCGSQPTNNNVEKTSVDIYVDESFKPLFETSIYTFEGQRGLTNINANYVDELTAIDAFLNNKTKTICITRDFTEEEKKALLNKHNSAVFSTKMAIDAVALIVHPENTDTLMTVTRLKEILNGRDSLWNGSNRKINIVFDKQNSANFLYMRKLAEVTNLPANVFAVNSNEEVIAFVKENRNALGIIGVNWISDEDDPSTLQFRDGINIVSVSENGTRPYLKPYQAYIYEQYHMNDGYPLVREVWLLNKAGKTSLNTSFVNFMSGEKGQLIIQKSSLIPANMVARMMKIQQ